MASKPSELLNAQLSKQLSDLQALAAVQRGVRLGLRSVWLGVGGGLLAWGTNALWGWFPVRWTWLLVGLLFALAPAAAFLLSLSPRARWVTKFDRRLGLQEQVSTAFEVAQTRRTGREAARQMVSDALVADVLAGLPDVRQRMLRRGWFLERDLVALVIVLLLAVMVYSSSLVRSYADLIGQANADISQPSGMLPPSPALPPPTDEPQAGAPQDGQGQQPGQVPAPSQGQPGGENGQESQEGGGQEPASGDPNALNEALDRLGQELSGQAPTFDLGQSLQQGDLEGAAGALEDLSDRLGDLSPETRQQLADALERAAGDVDAAGDPELGQDMRDAAGALRQDTPEGQAAAGAALDQLAEDLRGMSQDQQQSAQSGPGAGNGSGGEGGSTTPAERLQGEGGSLELPLEDSSQSGLLSPAPLGASGSGTASGSLDSSSQASGDAEGSPLVPNTFLWKWRDIVSSYFQR